MSNSSVWIVEWREKGRRNAAWIPLVYTTSSTEKEAKRAVFDGRCGNIRADVELRTAIYSRRRAGKGVPRR